MIMQIRAGGMVIHPGATALIGSSIEIEVELTAQVTLRVKDFEKTYIRDASW